MGTRRAARENAVQFLYQIDAHQPPDTARALAAFWKLAEASETVKKFGDALVLGVLERKPEIDAKIRGLADNWDFERIAVVDRNILRLAIFELLYRDDIPPVVTINEAIEIAKRFSTEDSGKFVNGILDRVRKELLRPARQASAG